MAESGCMEIYRGKQNEISGLIVVFHCGVPHPSLQPQVAIPIGLV